MVEYTAQGGGYFKVYKDDVYVSQHTAEREALEKAVNLTREYPESEIRVRHDSYNVLVEDDIQVPVEPLPSDLPAPVITDVKVFEDRIEVSHTHEGDYDNVEYAIKTRAYLDDKVSPFSNEVMVMGIGENVGENVGEEDSSNTFLPTPTNCQITDTQITTVSLSWDMPQNIGNTTSFLLIARGVSPVTYDTVTVSNKLATSGTITGLTQGSEYNCSVAAVSALGVAGSESNVVNVTTVSSYAPIWQSFTLPTVTVGNGWNIDLNNYVDASGGVITSFSVSSGILPNGITLDQDGTGPAGTFSGTASSQDTNLVYFTATNAAGSSTTVAQAWTVNAAGTGLAPAVYTRFINFENKNLGNNAWSSTANQDDFDAIGTLNSGVGPATCTIDNTHTFVGTQSAKLTWPWAAGGTGPVSVGGGPGSWLTGIQGEVAPFGAEVWYQIRVYFDSTWHETGVPGSQKFIRMGRTSKSGGTFNDLRLKPNEYACTPPGTTSMFTSNTYGGTSLRINNYKSSVHPTNGNEQLNQWNTYEWYIKVGSDASNSEMIVWRDHIPMEGVPTRFPGGVGGVCDEASGFILPIWTVDGPSDSLSGYIHHFGQWNTLDGTGGGPIGPSNPGQLWVDAIVTCVNGGGYTDTPTKTCQVTGRKFIGDWENG